MCGEREEVGGKPMSECAKLLLQRALNTLRARRGALRLPVPPSSWWRLSSVKVLFEASSHFRCSRLRCGQRRFAGQEKALRVVADRLFSNC